MHLEHIQGMLEPGVTLSEECIVLTLLKEGSDFAFLLLSPEK